MLNFVLAVAMAVEPCTADDLECLHRALQAQAMEIESLGRRLTLQAEQVKTAEDLQRVWREQAHTAYDALKEAASVIKPAPWYTHPVLWLGVGFTVATVLAVAIVYSLRPAFPLMP